MAPTVNSWLNTSGAHRPLCERTVVELSRRIELGYGGVSDIWS